MIKYVILFLFITLFYSCSSSIKVETKENYESIELPDGSQVYLNYNSTVTYDEEFIPRTIHMTGEVFFDVVHDESPFTVITEQGDIKVLGTEFNVKTTAKQIEVDVKKGLVELNTSFNKSKVRKDTKAVYKKGEKSIKKLSSNKAYRKWIRSLEKEFKNLGKEVRPALKKIGKEVKKIGKELKN